MDLNYLYNLAEKENIKIYDCCIENADGIFVNIDKLNAIALNYDNIETSIEEKETLAEELRSLLFSEQLIHYIVLT